MVGFPRKSKKVVALKRHTHLVWGGAKIHNSGLYKYIHYYITTNYTVPFWTLVPCAGDTKRVRVFEGSL